MNRKPIRGEKVQPGALAVPPRPPAPAPEAPAALPTPMMPPPAAAQAPVGPIMAPGPYPMATAPVRRIMHPTRVGERHTVIRYPIENIYPSHTKNIRHHVCEYYCEYPHTESIQDCYYTVDHCGAPPPYRRPN